MSKFKTYVLLDALNVTAPVFVRINKEERLRVDKMPLWKPYLRVTFSDKDGKNKTIRYKKMATSIYQDVQIKEQGIPANDPFTEIERQSLVFRNGVFMTDVEFDQQYLDAYPGNEAFEGKCQEVLVKAFKEYKESDDIKNANDDFKLRLQAGQKIIGLNLEEAQEMLIRLNGSFFEVPAANETMSEQEALEKCVQMLISFLDASEEAGLKAILQEEDTEEDTTTILVGKLLAANLLSFETEGEVKKKSSNGKFVKIADSAPGLDAEEKQRMFVDFLNSEDGKAHLTDLQNTLKKIDKK